MKQYTITLTDAEDKALNTVAISAQSWIDNAIHERCRVAMDTIIQNEIKRRLALGESITGTQDEIVLSAPVESVAERNARIDAEMQARLAAQQGE